MHDKQSLCEKITQLYPDIGECGIDLDVDYDDQNQAWLVDLKKDKVRLKTYLEDTDADACMLGKNASAWGFRWHCSETISKSSKRVDILFVYLGKLLAETVFQEVPPWMPRLIFP